MTTTTTTSTSLVPVADTFVIADAEQLALVGFLAGYRGATRAILNFSPPSGLVAQRDDERSDLKEARVGGRFAIAVGFSPIAAQVGALLRLNSSA